MPAGRAKAVPSGRGYAWRLSGSGAALELQVQFTLAVGVGEERRA